jgi:hypothetical protein
MCKALLLIGLYEAYTSWHLVYIKIWQMMTYITNSYLLKCTAGFAAVVDLHMVQAFFFAAAACRLEEISGFESSRKVKTRHSRHKINCAEKFQWKFSTSAINGKYSNEP